MEDCAGSLGRHVIVWMEDSHPEFRFSLRLKRCRFHEMHQMPLMWLKFLVAFLVDDFGRTSVIEGMVTLRFLTLKNHLVTEQA